MSFVKIRPFYPQQVAVKTFNQLANELMNRSLSEMVGNDFTANLPAVNIVETETGFVIQLAVPGLTKEAINIQTEKDRLTISAGNDTEAKPEETTAPKYLRHEFNYHRFSRSFQLPETVDSNQISAKYEAGVLVVSLLKKTNTTTPTRTIVIE